jgi:hypothetical protein
MLGNCYCEDCVFNEKCSPYEIKMNNRNCSNYIDMDFSDIIYGFQGDGDIWSEFSFHKFTDNFWNYVPDDDYDELDEEYYE